jgi:hypothetical protein
VTTRDDDVEDVADLGECGTETDEVAVELALVATVRALEWRGGDDCPAACGVPCAGGGVDSDVVMLTLARLLRDPRAVDTGVLGGVRVLRCCCCFESGVAPPAADAVTAWPPRPILDPAVAPISVMCTPIQSF